MVDHLCLMIMQLPALGIKPMLKAWRQVRMLGKKGHSVVRAWSGRGQVNFNHRHFGNIA